METGREITRFGIRIIAYVTMFIDHLAVIILLPLLSSSMSMETSGEPVLYSLLRDVGRLSFPLFSFMISEGVVYTKNGPKYFFRLLLLAIASVFPFGLAFQRYGLVNMCGNVVFNLSIGALMLLLIKYVEEKYTEKRCRLRALQGTIILLSGATAQLLQTDYGFYGVILTLLFYTCRRNRNRIFPICGLWMVGGFWLYSIIEVIQEYSFEQFRSWGGDIIGQFSMEAVLANCCAVFSLFIIYFYNGKEGKRISKTATYLFYPAHLLFLWVMAKVIL